MPNVAAEVVSDPGMCDACKSDAVHADSAGSSTGSLCSASRSPMSNTTLTAATTNVQAVGMTHTPTCDSVVPNRITADSAAVAHPPSSSAAGPGGTG